MPRTRAPVERGIARLKSWGIFRHARCSPTRMTSIARAVLAVGLDDRRPVSRVRREPCGG
ncbi:hypothetical protein GPJ59_22720 [Streptomyces bambusae]|uniref:Transposase n=1 Tax=Streptomyces bambusae TaxID=1550616 RepID=A0ABS6ZA42_9ACTN|nr:hypothetical protein [Streptomyces bambusae]